MDFDGCLGLNNSLSNDADICQLRSFYYASIKLRAHIIFCVHLLHAILFILLYMLAMMQISGFFKKSP